MDENFRDELNEHLKGDFHPKDEYHSVNVLLIWWEDSDLPGFKSEAQDLEKVFSECFGFSVQHYSIPSKQSQLSLERKIINVILDHCSKGSLLIIHYGGHGDEDDDRTLKQERQSVWAA
jgi:hypothetical protein